MDYAKDTQTRQSATGYVVYHEDAPTMHRSAMQKTVALSSCDAELNAAVLCAQDMMYQKNTLELIGLKVNLPMILEMDNKQCFLQELKEAEVLVEKLIPGSKNEADLFTKNLDGPLFKCYAVGGPVQKM